MNQFTILVLKGAFSSSVALTVDILASAALISGSLQAARPQWRLVSADGGLISLSSGMQISTTKITRRDTQGDSIWIIPGLAINSPSVINTRLLERDALILAKSINTHVKRGGSIAASCSAVFLLQLAGVLAGKTVTTTWWLASHLRRTLTNGTVDAQRMVIADGSIVTAGAALAHTDLMMYLIRKHLGSPLADAVSRVLLLDERMAQAQYVIPAVLAHGDELVTKLSAFVENSLPNVPNIRQLAREACMSERTLARHVVAATGLPPLALVQHVRLAKARTLLEASRLSVDKIAELVGYSDATALRRLMKKALGATPSRLRRNTIS
jgi:transcriptional regulator GlxA family with amidase domain